MSGPSAGASGDVGSGDGSGVDIGHGSGSGRGSGVDSGSGSGSGKSRGEAVATSPRLVCVVLHDVAGSTLPACGRLLAAVAEVATVPVTHLAVPRYHGETPTSAFEAWLGERVRLGDELALHGYTHRDDGAAAAAGWLDRLRRSHYTRGEGEFSALSEAEAAARIDAGIAWFRDHGWPLHGFVAPAWLLGSGGWQALDRSRARRAFAYTSTLRELVRLPSRTRLASQSVVYSTSSGWRRQLSLLWNLAVARVERGNALLRLELHPRDADFADVRRSWQRILERALRDREPTTVADAVRRLVPAAARTGATTTAG